MKMFGKQNHGVDVKRPSQLATPNQAPQHGAGRDVGQELRSAIGDDRKEKGASRYDGSTIVSSRKQLPRKFAFDAIPPPREIRISLWQ